jgi:acetate kinase
MNTLVLKPGRHELAFTFFSEGWSRPTCAGHVDDYRSPEGSERALVEVAKQIAQNSGRSRGLGGQPTGTDEPAGQKAQISKPTKVLAPDVIALRGVFGGVEFKAPTVVTPAVLRQLEKLVPYAPLHIPALLVLIRACQRAYPGRPVVLIFETAFFVGLPEREYLYALDASLTKTTGVRKFGYHGVLHAAACDYVGLKRREMGLDGPGRILSICLEPRPEACAVLGQKPLLVTSGATPLEGLPGQTTSGELDPSIILMLAQKKGWGPEQINEQLTQHSGWLGLVGRLTTLAEIFASHRPECQLAREVIQYRLLQVCGAGMAALGGLDSLVFSGRSSGVGVALGLWLKKKLDFQQLDRRNPITIEICPDSVERVLAETACATVLAARA